jgi:hypothetical protein
MAATETTDAGTRSGGRVFGRVSTETKQAFKTTEFYVYLLAVAGVLIAAAMIGEEEGGGGGGDAAGDRFGADEAWRYVTFLTIGYMISRGLAKAGSREPERQEATLGR